jgi:hypothetical protein
LVGHHVGGDELLAGFGQRHGIEVQVAAEGGIGVVAEALGVGDGDQEEVERPGGRFTVREALVTNETMIHPAELGGNSAATIPTEKAFGVHGQECGLRPNVAGTVGPADPVLWLSDGGRKGGCPLVTVNRGAGA